MYKKNGTKSPHLCFHNMSLKGHEIIKFTAKTLPKEPGVYQMEDKEGNILYIGKAKNLSKRVINYTSINNLTRRLQRMVSLTQKMNFFVTDSEIDALILECSLIKRHKPRFNIILRDDKSFPYILINKEHNFARIQKYRGSKKIRGDYFGPFVSPSVADYTIIALQKTFLLRSCSEATFKNRSRPCLLYDIKRCSAPCVNLINKKDYEESILDANKFLKGNTKKIEQKLQISMQLASKKQMYEEAARLRDRIKSVKQIQKYQSVFIKELRNVDIFAIKIEQGKSCVHGKFYRNGSNYGNKSFFPYHDESSNEQEILESFLYQFYLNRDLPPKILININSRKFKIVENILNLKSAKKTKILQPKAGEKLKLVSLAEKNAKENIRAKKLSIDNHLKAIDKLSILLNRNEVINRIEVFDNSHTFGSNALGVMIVADKEGLNSRHYRKYNIKKIKNRKLINNDYEMMSQVLDRRLSKIQNENKIFIPDVIIIDGGKGHFNIVGKIIEKYKLTNIDLIAVSKGQDRNKGREIIHTKNRDFTLKGDDPLLHFIQRLRDESHRFAITSHRARRIKNTTKSVFEELDGIGPTRKKILINHFGNIEKIKNASLEELKEVKAIPIKILIEIYEFFHSV